MQTHLLLYHASMRLRKNCLKCLFRREKKIKQNNALHMKLNGTNNNDCDQFSSISKKFYTGDDAHSGRTIVTADA